jgi:uncharacterized protein (TIGR03067 family)
VSNIRERAVNRVAILSTFVILCFAAPAPADDKEDLKMMEGEWAPTAGEFGGKTFPEDILKSIKLVLKGDTYTVGAGEQTDRGTIKLDASKTPKAMDITGTEGPNKGKTFPAIYELSGDTLKVCYNLGGSDRPTEFKTKEGTQFFLATYKRAKKE